MQSDHKELYKITAERTGESEDTYKDIGNFVFSSLYDFFRHPESLIIKLKGVGSWHLRRKRMQIILDHYPIDYDKTVEDFDSDIALLKYENKKELHTIFKDRLKEYEEYIKIRDEVRKERYKTQKLLTPKNHD